MDVLDGGTIFSEWFSFKETPAFSSNLELFGLDNMNFLINSGSFFPVIAGMLTWLILKFLLNKACTYLPHKKWVRSIGIWAYDRQYLHTLSQGTLKLFLESYFDLTMCQILACYGFIRAASFLDFFADA